MINKTFVFTSIVAALFMAIALKFLHLFKFIKWSPVSWTKHIFTSTHYSVKWLLLFLGLSLIFALLYLLVSFLDAVPPSVSAITLSVIVLYLLYNMIGEPKSVIQTLRTVSIPLFSVTAITFRFITGTAVFMRHLSRKV